MHSPADDANAQESGQAFDPNVDHYPELHDVLAWIGGSPDLPDGPIDRLEVTCQANGDATCRVWPAREEEPIGIVQLGDLQ